MKKRLTAYCFMLLVLLALFLASKLLVDFSSVTASGSSSSEDSAVNKYICSWHKMLGKKDCQEIALKATFDENGMQAITADWNSIDMHFPNFVETGNVECHYGYTIGTYRTYNSFFAKAFSLTRESKVETIVIFSPGVYKSAR